MRHQVGPSFHTYVDKQQYQYCTAAGNVSADEEYELVDDNAPIMPRSSSLKQLRPSDSGTEVSAVRHQASMPKSRAGAVVEPNPSSACGIPVAARVAIISKPRMPNCMLRSCLQVKTQVDTHRTSTKCIGISHA